MIVDAQNRKLAVLGENAAEVSWDNPAGNYVRYQENAFDLEKLW